MVVAAMKYRIHLWCPRCDKEAEAVAPLIPNPRIRCGDCLMERVEIVEMKIVAAEQLEDQT
jgi:hypothetical protein